MYSKHTGSQHSCCCVRGTSNANWITLGTTIRFPVGHAVVEQAAPLLVGNRVPRGKIAVVCRDALVGHGFWSSLGSDGGLVDALRDTGAANVVMESAAARKGSFPAMMGSLPKEVCGAQSAGDKGGGRTQAGQAPARSIDRSNGAIAASSLRMLVVAR